jgi:hypothetical protein
MTRLERQYHIPKTTLYDWRITMQINPDWRAWDNDSGQHRKFFTEKQEEDLAELIMENWVDRHVLLTNSDLREIAIEFWLTSLSEVILSHARMDSSLISKGHTTFPLDAHAARGDPTLISSPFTNRYPT